MKKILIAGVLYQPFASFPMMRQSDDGKNWDDPVQPFDVGDSPTAMATDGIDVAVSNGRGYLAVTTDTDAVRRTETAGDHLEFTSVRTHLEQGAGMGANASIATACGS